MAVFEEIKGRTRFKAPIAEEAFLDISSTCLDQESRSSMVSPKDLVRVIPKIYQRAKSICLVQNIALTTML